MNRHSISRDRQNTAVAGFTLLEFLVAMALFLVLSGATFSLFRSHAPYFNRQQNLAGVNIQMQNALTQMQLDASNAGTGFYQNINMSSWPVGVTLINQLPASDCHDSTTYQYSATCFDQLNILTINPAVLPAHPTDITGGAAACSDTTASTSFYIQPSSGLTVAQTAANFNIGDQVILVTGGNGAKVGTFVVNAAPSTGVNYVMLSHDESTAATVTVTNSSGTTSNVTVAVNSTTDDPLGISTNPSASVASQFCGTDWLMKLEPTIYKVDVTTATDPKLVRSHGGSSDVIAEQVIGFKVGAAYFGDNSGIPYHFNPADYGSSFSLIRSLMVSLIGRTNPNPDPTYTFNNAFDGGPYQVVGSTIVINPRNLSLNSY